LEDLAGQISRFGYIGASIIVVALVITNIIQYGGVAEYFGMGWIGILKNILTIAVTALTIIVAAVPEGLPLIINLITAQNAKVMIKHNVLAKHTNKIPEAGNIQLLCTDKTGTLTVGKLVPVENVMGDGKSIIEDENTYNLFKYNVILNSSAMFDENNKIVGGNATERALLSLVNADEYKKITGSTTIVNKKSFNSANKFSAVETEYNGETFTYYKGAPERLIDAATKCVTLNGLEPIDKDKLKMIVRSYTVKAMRVIATGYSSSKLPEDGFPNDLIITSLVAIRDDVRPEVPEAVAKMHDAGVQVMMVTGDVIDTAKAIAKDAGLITSESDIAMSAIDFDALSDEEAKEKLPYIKVIARATPNTKLRIVRLAQELGLCVGMTGDGTNDAPALKAADVGFSMGSGTDVCKEAGDIIITDDNFVSITDAVLLGRTFMHNVMKFLKFQLPINVGLVLLSILYPIIMSVEAIAAVQILVINIVMDSLNSLSFGGEPAKDEYMKEKPIPKGSKLLSKETIGQIAVSVVAFIGIFGITLLPSVQKIFGNDEAIYATARFALLVMMATFNGFNIRTDGFNLFKGIRKNKLFVEIAVAIFALTFVLAQYGGDIMGCTAMTPTQWGVTVVLAFMIIPIDLVRKAIIKIKRK
jgi:calcium-translocating P-type ATPase